MSKHPGELKTGEKMNIIQKRPIHSIGYGFYRTRVFTKREK